MHIGGERLDVIHRRFVLHPAHQPHHERGFSHDFQHAEALLAHGDDVAAVVVTGFTFEDLGAASDLRHLLGFGIPTNHPKTAVTIKHRAQHHAVTVLENMQWQHFLGEEHHVWQWEKRQLPYGQLSHGVGRTEAILRSNQGQRAG